MDNASRNRFDRSRYGTNGDKFGTSARHAKNAHDDFYDDIRLSAADPQGLRTVADYSRAEAEDQPQGEHNSQGNSHKAHGDKVTDRKSVHPKKASTTPRKKPYNKRRIAVIVGIAVAVVLAIGAIGAFAFYNKISSNLHSGISDDLRSALVQTDLDKEPFYMLLLGTDGSSVRDDDPEFGGQYRSDSMMLARIDPVEKKVCLISISRDIIVNLGSDYGEQKINAAYALGGPALAVRAVSELAGVPINHYAEVNFDGFQDMVDALGGVDVDVPTDIDDEEAGGSLSKGMQTLTGEQALILCRSRNAYATTAAQPDLMRAANQRLVLSAIAKKLLASDVGTIASTVETMSKYVVCDLELTDIIGLAQKMHGLDPDASMYTASVPTTSQYIGDGWYEIVNKKEWSEMMQRVENGQPPLEEAVIDERTGVIMATSGAGTSSSADKEAVITVKNSTDTPGLASKVRSKLLEQGFVNVTIEDMNSDEDYPETVIIYDQPGQEREAQSIVEVIGQGNPTENDGSYLLVDTDFIIIIGDDWHAE